MTSGGSSHGDGATGDSGVDRYRILFEFSRDAHLIFDTEGIRDCNQAAVEILGMESRDQLIGVHPAAFSPKYQPDGQLSSEKSKEMDGLARKNGYHRFNWMHCRLDGTPIPIEVTLTHVDYHGHGALMTVWRDLTERVNRERELEDARDIAEQAMHARTRFLATMSHEMRTPLNGVIASSQLLSDREEDARNLELCHIIKESAEHLLSMIDDVLDFSRIDEGQMELHHAPLSLHATGKRLVSFLMPKAKEKGIKLTWEVDNQIPPYVSGDCTRIDQVLLNLLTNAVKFTQDGSVHLNISKKPDDEVEFQVVDTGIGIPREKLAYIFDPFRQIDSKTTRKYEGSGLGLTISRDLAKLMGGELTCKSTAGEGTTFTFVVNLPPCDPPPSPDQKSQQPSFNGLRVLLVDDNKINRRVLELLLKKLGCTPQTAGDGKQALELVADSSYDLIVMDLHMPGMDGLEATGRIRGKGFNMPILGLTASTAEEELNQCLEAGMNDVLTKPVRVEKLEAALLQYATDGRVAE